MFGEENNTIARVGQLKNLKRGANLAPSYLKIEVDKPQRFVFIGLTTALMNDNGEQVERPAVALANENGPVFSVGVSLYKTFEQSNCQPGTPVEIVYKGEVPVKNGNGKVKTFEVYVLQ